MIVGIIGGGFVGKALKLLECDDLNMLIYDINKDLCNPKNIEMKDLLKCECIFLCLPTPMNPNGSCNIDIICNVVKNLRDLNYKGCIICKSTVPVDTCDNLNINFCPEFLTEKNYEEDFINTSEWIIGLLNNTNIKLKELFSKMINIAYKNGKIKSDKVVYLTNKEAEMVKLFKNSYLATKVSFCNEMYEYCKKKNINYDIVRNNVVLDKRIEKSHTLVPGHDNNFGFGGTCLVKDIHNLEYEMELNNCNCLILKNVIKRNETIDRQEKDWMLNKGRAVI
jgi:UDPglucose 6-dehydrogenase